MSLLRSAAAVNLAIVTVLAVVFRSKVSACTVVGGMLYYMKNLARMLPNASHFPVFISDGLFSLMLFFEGKRGLLMKTK